MSIRVFECPICHSQSMAEFPPGSGDSFVLTEVDTKAQNFIPTSGLPVKIMACTNCHYLLLKNDSIKFTNE